MKKLSDYTGVEAVELWADLLEPMTKIIGDSDVANKLRAKLPPILIAKEILKKNPNEAVEVMERIDDTPVDGFNILARLVSLLNEFMSNPATKDFFTSVAVTEETSFGSATENTEETQDTSSNM